MGKGFKLGGAYSQIRNRKQGKLLHKTYHTQELYFIGMKLFKSIDEFN